MYLQSCCEDEINYHVGGMQSRSWRIGSAQSVLVAVFTVTFRSLSTCWLSSPFLFFRFVVTQICHSLFPPEGWGCLGR